VSSRCRLWTASCGLEAPMPWLALLRSGRPTRLWQKPGASTAALITQVTKAHLVCWFRELPSSRVLTRCVRCCGYFLP